MTVHISGNAAFVLCALVFLYFLYRYMHSYRSDVWAETIYFLLKTIVLLVIMYSFIRGLVITIGGQPTQQPTTINYVVT